MSEKPHLGSVEAGDQNDQAEKTALIINEFKRRLVGSPDRLFDEPAIPQGYVDDLRKAIKEAPEVDLNIVEMHINPMAFDPAAQGTYLCSTLRAGEFGLRSDDRVHHIPEKYLTKDHKAYLLSIKKDKVTWISADRLIKYAIATLIQEGEKEKIKVRGGARAGRTLVQRSVPLDAALGFVLRGEKEVLEALGLKSVSEDEMEKFVHAKL